MGFIIKKHSSGRLFSSLSYDIKARLLLVSCRPAPNALHIVMQLAVSRLPGGSRAVVGQVVAQVAGGSYRERSFLRAALVDGAREGQVAALCIWRTSLIVEFKYWPLLVGSACLWSRKWSHRYQTGGQGGGHWEDLAGGELFNKFCDETCEGQNSSSNLSSFKVLIGKPVLDIQSAEINGSRYLAALGETDLTMYKWE